MSNSLAAIRRRQDKRQAWHRCIQVAARTVFAERGYAGATIELIARSAQLSVGAIYLHFRSKEDLYVSLIEDALFDRVVEMEQVSERIEATKRFREIWDILARWAECDAEGPQILRLLAQPGVRQKLSDEVVSAVSAGLASIQNRMGASIADGIHAGVYRQVNAREIADFAWSALLGSLDADEMQNNLGTPPGSLDARTERALALIETMLGAPRLEQNCRAEDN